MFRYIALFVLTLSVHAVQAAALPERMKSWEGITEYRLENGMSILLAPDATQGVIHVDLVYLTGSLADPDQFGGMAHFLEHMMFKGTAQRTGEQLLTGLRERGIQFNATTSFDRTRYSAMFSADQAKLDFLLNLEAERMVSPVFSEADMSAELDVIRQEIARAQNDPLAMLGAQMSAQAWNGEAYGRSVLGRYDELRRLTPEDLRQFHAHYYHPNNTVLVLTGGFEIEPALASITEHFATISPSSHAINVPKMPSLRYGQGEARVYQGNLNVFALGYGLPPGLDEHNAMLAVLADVLAGEPHGRLYRSLVVPGKVQSVFALPQLFRQGGQFMVGATLAKGQSHQVVQPMFTAQLEALLEQPVTADELARAQASMRSLKGLIMNDPASLSDILSESAALGDWQLQLRRLARVDALELQQVQAQIESLLANKKPVMGYLLTEQENEGKGWLSKVRALLSDGDTTVASIARPQPSVPDGVVTTLSGELPDLDEFNAHIRSIEQCIQRDELSNGMKVALRPLPGTSGMVSGQLNLRFGDQGSLRGTQAVSRLTGLLLMRGTHNRSYQDVVDRTNQLGAGFSVVPQGGMLVVRFVSPAENLEELLQLIAEVLQKPSFPQQEFELVRRQQRQALQTPSDNPAEVALVELRRQTETDYPQGDIRRYLEPEEMIAALDAVTRDDVVRFHQDFYGAQHGEIALSGDFDSAQITATLETLWGSWMSLAPYQRILAMHRDQPPVRRKVDAGSTGGHYLGRIYFAANSDTEEDAEIFLVEHILGRHPLASRLGKRLREQEQLTYDLRSSIRVPTTGDHAFVSIHGDFTAGQGERLANIVKEEVARIAEFGITQHELDLAKRTILSERRRALNNDQTILGLLPRQLAEGTTMESWIIRNQEYTEAGLEQVNAAARRYFNAAKMVEIIAGPE